MAEEEDLSSLSLTERWVHKKWNIRKEAYQEAAQEFEKSPNEHAPVFRPFIQDSNLMKAAAGDANVAAQQEGLNALCKFLQTGSREGAVRTRPHTVVLLVEKGLPSTRQAIKDSALEALLLYIDHDGPGPVIEDMLPVLSNKQPKLIAATLFGLTRIYQEFGCKVADPKPVLKLLPKTFGHADKNVRAETTKLAVEFYRWLRDAMKPMLWNDLKKTQQDDLEAQFEKITAEGPPKQNRLMNSQKEARAMASAGGEGEGEEAEDDGEDPGSLDPFDLAEPQDVLSKVPKEFFDNLNSTKWKERKEAVDALYIVVNIPRIRDGDFGEITRGLAKCMKDANIAVVTTSAQCIEALAKGLRHGFSKYRTVVMQPILERLKEKKQAVSDALGAALDQVFLATSLGDCLEDITAYLVHKNPQIKEGTMKFLVRSLKTTREVPTKQEIGTIVESGKKLLSESSEGLRSGGADILGHVMKIIGERVMKQHLEGLDDIRKTKIKECFEAADVKAKDKPKPAPAPAARPAAGGPKKAGGSVKKAPTGSKKAAPAATAAATGAPADATTVAPQPSSKAGPGSKSGMPKPLRPAGLKAPQKRTIAAPGTSPRRVSAAAPSPVEDEPASPPPVQQPVSRLGPRRGGLATRSLAKPSAAPMAEPGLSSPTASSGMTDLERAELEELRAANDRLVRQVEDALHDRQRLMSEIQELKNVIEDHKHDVLSIKVKEAQLVRARNDAEAAERTNERLQRELEKWKRAATKTKTLSTARGPGSPESPKMRVGMISPTHGDAGSYRDGGYSSANHNRASHTSTLSEDKESGDSALVFRNKLGPDARYSGSAAAGGRESPTHGYRRDTSVDDGRAPPSAGSGLTREGSHSDRGSRSGSRTGENGAAAGAGAGGQESWRRAAEVTSQLKARIELMKAKQGMSRS